MLAFEHTDLLTQGHDFEPQAIFESGGKAVNHSKRLHTTLTPETVYIDLY
jgi:hypothetical protein